MCSSLAHGELLNPITHHFSCVHIAEEMRHSWHCMPAKQDKWWWCWNRNCSFCSIFILKVFLPCKRTLCLQLNKENSYLCLSKLELYLGIQENYSFFFLCQKESCTYEGKQDNLIQVYKILYTRILKLLKKCSGL